MRACASAGRRTSSSSSWLGFCFSLRLSSTAFANSGDCVAGILSVVFSDWSEFLGMDGWEAWALLERSACCDSVDVRV